MRLFAKITFSVALLLSCTLLNAQKSNADIALELLHLRYSEFYAIWNGTSNADFEVAIGNIRSAYDNLDPALKEEVKDSLLSHLIKTFETKSNDEFLKEANEVLAILPAHDDSEMDIYSIIADIYAKRGNREMLGHYIGMMESEPLSMREEYADVIKGYEEIYATLKPFTEILSGWWVSDYRPYFLRAKQAGNWPTLIINNGSYYGNPACMLDRKSHLLYKEEYRNYYCDQPHLSGYYPLNYNLSDRTFEIVMLAGQYRQGNQMMANQYLSSAQQTKAEFSALARDRRATLGQTAAASAIGALSAAGYEAMAMNAATSTASEEVLSIVGTPINDNTLSAHILYQQQSMKSYYYAPTSFVIFNTDTKFYRWREEYGIVFGDQKCRPISPFVNTLTPDMELYKIKKETNLWNSGYWKRSLLHLGITAAIGGFAFWNLNTAFKGNGGIGNIILGSIFSMGTIIYPEFALYSVSKKRGEYRNEIVKRYNRGQLDKLKELSE